MILRSLLGSAKEIVQINWLQDKTDLSLKLLLKLFLINKKARNLNLVWSIISHFMDAVQNDLFQIIKTRWTISQINDIECIAKFNNFSRFPLLVGLIGFFTLFIDYLFIDLIFSTFFAWNFLDFDWKIEQFDWR